MEIPRFGSRPGSISPDDADPLVILSAWWRAVGDPVARLASVRGMIRRRLQVSVPDQRWKGEIGRHLEEILARVRGIGGLQGLEGIDLVVEQAIPGAPSPSWGEAAEVPAGQPPREILIAAKLIPDTRQAQRWEGAVGKILARREARHGS